MIQFLTPDTISKIKAGEVIDRPASIVKELIDNSLDSGATQVRIEVLAGGKSQIRITDNGRGILPDDMPIAPLEHTTSKINRFEDIYQTPTMGFRGEALASICHIATLTITSKTEHADAYEITAEEGNISPIKPVAHKNGTTVIVKDIFKPVPVRQNYLKSDATEFSYVFDIVLQAALINPKIDFILTHDDKEVLNTTGLNTYTSLLIHQFGKTLKDNLIDVDLTINGIAFRGAISSPKLTFPTRNRQFLAVNHRVIRSPILQKAIQEGYRDLIPDRRHPLILLDMSILGSHVDINIHPQKHEVKFINPGQVFDSMLSVLKKHHSTVHTIPSNPSAVGASPNWPTWQTPASSTPLSHTVMPGSDQVLQLFNATAPLPTQTAEFFQAFQTYLFINGPDGVWILDQHAVHERILYEKIKVQFGKSTQTQALLIGEVVELTPDLFALFEAEQDFFKNLNFDIETFGKNTLIIRQVPVVLADIGLRDFVLTLLDSMKAMPGSQKDDLSLEKKDALQMKACKAAIKAGQTLKPAEVHRLIHDFQHSPANFTCPHGRPLFIKLTQPELEKLFMRR